LNQTVYWISYRYPQIFLCTDLSVITVSAKFHISASLEWTYIVSYSNRRTCSKGEDVEVVVWGTVVQEEENFLGTAQSMPYRTRVSVIGASMSEPILL